MHKKFGIILQYDRIHNIVWYGIIDVLLVTDIENFSETSFGIYKLNPVWCYTTPGFAQNCKTKNIIINWCRYIISIWMI